MICPFCANEKTKVIGVIKGLENKRFRYCPKCQKGFETKEKVCIKPTDFEYLNKNYKEYIYKDTSDEI